MNGELMANHLNHQAREQEGRADIFAAGVLAANLVEIDMGDHRRPTVILRDFVQKGLVAAGVEVILLEEISE